MAAGLKLCTLLLVTVTKFGLTDGDCTSGWFGKKCRFMCHCKNSTSCGPEGECPNGEECKQGYFGPGCQYVDLVHSEATVDNKEYIDDNDDTTCNPDPRADTETIFLLQPVPIMWFRIVVNDNTNLNNFTVLMNEFSTRCDNERRTRVNSLTVDVSCDTIIPMQELNLQGPMVASICTVHITGGRNVAIKQDATQSSDFVDIRFPPNRTEATNAVDGFNSRSIASFSCARTGTELDGPEWHLQYDMPQLIIRTLLYTAKGSINYFLYDFKLMTFGEDGNTTNIYVNPGTVQADIYDIPLPAREPVTRVMIKASTKSLWSNRSMVLCEVETYGETLCPEGMYGLDCDKKCLCGDGQHCNIATGACSKGCGPLFYGFNCSFVCHGNCFEDLCDQRSGRCHICKPGYQNTNCSEVCHPGTYGIDCISNCSVHCSDVCDQDYGLCNCTDPFVGPTCEACPDGFFGHNCLLNCSHNCEDDRCDLDDGSCLKCSEGYIGKFCEDCPRGYYGFKCSSQCSENCGNETCNPNDGSCLSCRDGYTGSRCAIGPPDMPMKWPYYLLLLIPIALIILCGFLAMKKKSDHSGDDTGS